jgi:hypothetical protein
MPNNAKKSIRMQKNALFGSKIPTPAKDGERGEYPPHLCVGWQPQTPEEGER